MAVEQQGSGCFVKRDIILMRLRLERWTQTSGQQKMVCETME